MTTPQTPQEGLIVNTPASATDSTQPESAAVLVNAPPPGNSRDILKPVDDKK
jgi:hypothetical protein